MEERLGEPSSHARIGRWRRSSAESLWRVRVNQCGKRKRINGVNILEEVCNAMLTVIMLQRSLPLNVVVAP